MPVNNDYVKSSRIDQLYDKKDSYESYEQLRIDVAAINQSIINEEGNIIFDNVYDSHSNISRHLSNTNGVSKKGSKKIVYGIVVANSLKNPGRNVYVDVPLQNVNSIQDDSIFLKEEADLKNYQELIFYPIMNVLQKTPQQGALCLVEIPENYPNHSISNPEDAVFIDLYRKDILIPLDIARPTPTIIPGSIEDMLKNVKSRTGIQTGTSEGGAGGGSSSDEYSDGEYTGQQATIVDHKYIHKSADNYKECLGPGSPFYDRYTKLLTREPSYESDVIKLFRKIFAGPTQGKGYISEKELSYANAAADYYKIDPDIMLVLGAIETHWTKTPGQSIKGAMGRYQLMPIAMKDTVTGGTRGATIRDSQGWMKKLTGIKHELPNGNTTDVLILNDSGIYKGLYTPDPRFVIKREEYAYNLGLPKFWEIAAYYGARSWIANIGFAKYVVKYDNPGDYILFSGTYNKGISFISEQINKNNYKNIALWNVYDINKESYHYMIQFHAMYRLLKCARKLSEKEKSS